MRFRTFLLDSEHERQQMGWLSDDEDAGPNNSKSRGKSLWDYVEELHKKSSLFYNFKYSKEHSYKVSFPSFVDSIGYSIDNQTNTLGNAS